MNQTASIVSVVEGAWITVRLKKKDENEMNTLKLPDEKKEKLIIYYQITRNIAVVAAIFSLIVSVIILANFIQLKINDPINSPQLKALIEKNHSGLGRKGAVSFFQPVIFQAVTEGDPRYRWIYWDRGAGEFHS